MRKMFIYRNHYNGKKYFLKAKKKYEVVYVYFKSTLMRVGSTPSPYLENYAWTHGKNTC